MISAELRRWLDMQCETITVEMTRADAHRIRTAIFRAATASRKPEHKEIFEQLGIRFYRSVDWGADDD